MKNQNTTNNSKLTAAQKRAITIANKKALKALSDIENKALAIVESEELQSLTHEQYSALEAQQKALSYQALSIRELELLTALEAQDNTINSQALAVIERDFIESSATLESAINSIEQLVSNRIIQVQLELESKTALCSDSKKDALQKNIINRLKANKAFSNASAKTLQMIVDSSSASTLEYLLNASNYKTASRILDAAKFLNDEKHSSIIDYTLSALKRSSYQQTSVDNVCAISNQCYARISNAIKALAFFDLIDVKDCSRDKNLITKMSKNTLVSLKASQV